MAKKAKKASAAHKPTLKHPWHERRPMVTDAERAEVQRRASGVVLGGAAEVESKRAAPREGGAGG